jgi:tetratricopeptide (TPR) repeat protein
MITRCAEVCGTTVELPPAPDAKPTAPKARRSGKRARKPATAKESTSGRAVHDPKGRFEAARVRKVFDDEAQASAPTPVADTTSPSSSDEPFVPIGASAAPPSEEVRRKQLIYRMQKALAWSPDDAKLHKNIAYAYEQDGQRDQAAHHYSEYLRLEPTAWDADDVRKKIFRLRVPVD